MCFQSRWHMMAHSPSLVLIPMTKDMTLGLCMFVPSILKALLHCERSPECFAGRSVAHAEAIIVVALRLVMRVRIPEEQEIEGVDQHTHGETYHSPVKKYPQTKVSESSDTSDAV